jgi:hypothetical protein
MSLPLKSLSLWTNLRILEVQSLFPKMYASAVKVSTEQGNEVTKWNTIDNIWELLIGLNRHRPHVISRKVSVNVVSHNTEEPSQEPYKLSSLAHSSINMHRLLTRKCLYRRIKLRLIDKIAFGLSICYLTWLMFVTLKFNIFTIIVFLCGRVLS